MNRSTNCFLSKTEVKFLYTKLMNRSLTTNWNLKPARIKKRRSYSHWLVGSRTYGDSCKFNEKLSASPQIWTSNSKLINRKSFNSFFPLKIECLKVESFLLCDLHVQSCFLFIVLPTPTNENCALNNYVLVTY